MIQYCPSCAAALPGPPPVACVACAHQLFVNPRPSGNAIICVGDEFLTARRAREPRAGEWELPGGFCDGWELPAAAAVREVREELGLDIELSDFVGMYLGDYSYQGEVLPVLDCFWRARIISGEVRLNAAELLEYRWAPLADPPAMAFPTMDAALVELNRKVNGRV